MNFRPQVKHMCNVEPLIAMYNLQVRNNGPLAIKIVPPGSCFTHTSSYHKLILYGETVSCYHTHLSAIYHLMPLPAAVEPLDLYSVNEYCARIVWRISIQHSVHSVALSKKMIGRWHILLPRSIKAVWRGDSEPVSQTQLWFLSWDCWTWNPMITFWRLSKKHLGFGKSHCPN